MRRYVDLYSDNEIPKQVRNDTQHDCREIATPACGNALRRAGTYPMGARNDALITKD